MEQIINAAYDQDVHVSFMDCTLEEVMSRYNITKENVWATRESFGSYICLRSECCAIKVPLSRKVADMDFSLVEWLDLQFHVVTLGNGKNYMVLGLPKKVVIGQFIL